MNRDQDILPKKDAQAKSSSEERKVAKHHCHRFMSQTLSSTWYSFNSNNRYNF